MTEQITMLILGILFLFLGITNIKGDISSIHWYNRTRITEETRLKYGKLMGLGTVFVGGGLVLSAALNILTKSTMAIIIGGVIISITAIGGVGLMLYAQIKYNKGIF